MYASICVCVCVWVCVGVCVCVCVPVCGNVPIIISQYIIVVQHNIQVINYNSSLG